MALRGNLKDFSLPDVFQLVQLSGKTGVLRIAGPEAEGSIWFRDGDVFFAQSNWRREQLGERLVNAQRITPAALARALDLRAAESEGGRRLGEILVGEGYITQQVLETFVQEQIQDTIFDLMRWDEGDFDFEVLPEVVREDIGLAVSVENIVMEGARRLEEWQRIKKKVPSTEMVFKMATAPGEGTFEISLKPIEWALLLLIDGTRSIRELATETHSTDFDVARVVYGLFSAGLLEVPADDEIERLRADRARREDKRAALESQQAETRDVEEARLAADAEARLSATGAAAEQVPAAVEVPLAEEVPAVEAPAAPDEDVVVPSTEPRHVPEEPEFLAGSGEPPSSDDMAMFEQMMASVLTPPEEAEPPADEFPPAEVPPAEGVAEPEAAPAEGFIPGLDFVPDAPSDEEPETPFVPYAPSIEPEPPSEVAAESESVPTGTDVDEFGFGAISDADLESIPAPPVAEEGEVSAPAAPTGDFETDLRALGLGEMPEELLQPEAPAIPRLPMSEMGATFAHDGAEPVFEAPETQAEPEIVFEPEPEPTYEVDAEAVPEPELSDGDLDALLESLEGQAEQEGMIASDVDYGPESETSGGVISTDAFLAEFDTDAGLSGGLGDELTALTGGAGARSRPMATVTKIPEAGEGPMLHRDQMVDRSLLEQIIAGIENL